MVPLLRPVLSDFLTTLPYPAEAIFVNDGSSDQTLDLLLEWASINWHKVTKLAEKLRPSGGGDGWPRHRNR